MVTAARKVILQSSGYGEEIIRKMTIISHGTDCNVYGGAHIKVK